MAINSAFVRALAPRAIIFSRGRSSCGSSRIFSCAMFFQVRPGGALPYTPLAASRKTPVPVFIPRAADQANRAARLRIARAQRDKFRLGEAPARLAPGELS